MPEKVLILDEIPLRAMDVELTISESRIAEPVVASTLSEAEQVGSVQAAFLSRRASGNWTYDLARHLISRGVPVTFVFAGDDDMLPDDLAGSRLVRSTRSTGEIIETLRMMLQEYRTLAKGR